MRNDTVLTARVYYADGRRADVGPGWSLIFDLRAGTVAAAHGTTKSFWRRPDSVIEDDDKLLLSPGGFAAAERERLPELARRFASRFGCGTERQSRDAWRLPLNGVEAFLLVDA